MIPLYSQVYHKYLNGQNQLQLPVHNEDLMNENSDHIRRLRLSPKYLLLGNLMLSQQIFHLRMMQHPIEQCDKDVKVLLLSLFFRVNH